MYNVGTKSKQRGTDIMRIADSVEKLGRTVTDSYKRIENGVVGAYRKIETGAVSGFEKVMDKCIELAFTREGESVADAKKRLSANKAEL